MLFLLFLGSWTYGLRQGGWVTCSVNAWPAPCYQILTIIIYFVVAHVISAILKMFLWNVSLTCASCSLLAKDLLVIGHKISSSSSVVTKIEIYFCGYEYRILRRSKFKPNSRTSCQYLKNILLYLLYLTFWNAFPVDRYRKSTLLFIFWD